MIGRRLNRVIASTGMTLTEFAGWVSVPEHTLRSWAHDRTEPRGLADARALKEREGLTWKEAMARESEKSGVRQLMNIRRLTGCTWEDLLG